MKKGLPISADKIIEHIENEYQSSLFFTEAKRQLFKKRKKLYMSIEDQDKKIYSRLIFSTIETLLALYVKAWPSANFSVNGEFFDEIEKTIKMVAESDFKRMKLWEKDERANFHSFFYGTSIKVLDGFDTQRKNPECIVISPMQWICDPQASINLTDRFHGFELQVDKSSLTEDGGYFNLDKLEPWEWRLAEEDRESAQSIRHLKDDYGTHGLYNIYHHYTIINGKKYLVTLGNNRKLLIRCEEITPKNSEQKKDPRLIKFPVVVGNRVPTEFDRWGISICDILEDKQTATQLFLNLNRIKAENEAWGDMFLYDPDIVENIDELQMPKLWPKYIKASGLNKGGTPLIEVQRGNIKSDAFNMPNVIKQQGFLDIGLDERSLWVTGATPITATENQRVQANANLRQLLGLKRRARSEELFWELWYESYQECFYGKKKIKVPGRYGGRYLELEAKDFIVEDSVEVIIEFALDVEEKNDKTKLEMIATRDAFMNDPQKSDIAKKVFERELFRLQGFSPEKIALFSEKTLEEEQAELDLELLNRDEELEPIADLNENHLVYLEIYKRAKDTPAKHKAIWARRQAQMQKLRLQGGQNQIMGTGDQQMKGQIVSSMMAQANSAPNNAESLAQISQ